MPSTSARKAAGASQHAATRAAAAQRGASPTQADHGVAQPAGDGNSAADASQRSVSAADTVLAATIMSDIRHLGRLPLRVRGQEAHKCAERNLAAKFIRAKGKGIFTREQLQELDSLGDAGGAPQPASVNPQRADELMQESYAKAHGQFSAEQLQELDSMSTSGGAPQPAAADSLMNEIRSLGRLPRRVRGDAEAQQSERNLAQCMTNAKKKKLFSEAQLAELSTFAAGCRHVA